VPQTKVKFFQIDKETQNIDDEHHFVAEQVDTLSSEELIKYQAQFG
jgi:hypothetical protein